MNRTQFFLLLIISSFTCNGYALEAAVSKSAASVKTNEVSEVIQSDLKESTDAQAQESLLTIIREQKKYIEQLEASKNQAFKEMSELSSNKGFDYSAWVSVLLASIGVLVTVVGVMIALISFVGYKNFKESTKEAAETISRTTASTVAREEVKVKINEVAKLELARLIDSGDLKEHLESAVDVIFRKNVTSQGMSGFNKYPEIDEVEGES
ncbi:hypothetical protein [Vibrio diazotrophicus]|uniref:hypothetical protein n=1 Tax=Vibrio diazotrophicus TaxID=685 RepID=UPI000C9DAB7B|nr:hypothetical protein [Vibrio diazotrophicus]PNH95604.1 hypothetical protein C1O24_13970 [Vibrio diazotrophicus]